jgi:short subunit dehydrogenase-like uncharacterized protein
MKNERTYDLVVFGATSFAGEILCRYLVERHGIAGDLRWAIAGRNADKLETVVASTGADVPRIVADAGDPEALAQLAASTRVVASTVGPYALYGTGLVAAAVAGGTDYCDLTGEPQWMQEMIDTYGDQAAASGARIVHTCGFDSIPSDLGVWFTQQQAIERFGQPCERIAMRVQAAKGGASGGTVASMLNMMEEMKANPELRRMLANPFALAPEGMRSGPKQPNVTMPKRDSVSGSWVAPFVMAAINTRVVHRSHALAGRPWGDSFMYDEAMDMGDGPFGAAKATAFSGGMAGFMGLAAVGPIRRGLERFVLPKPGEGPSPEAQAAGFYDLRFYGSTADGDKLVVKVTGDADPGYGSTAKMLGEAAVCLLDLPASDTAGGFWTPATAFGQPLLDALIQHAGLTFEVLDT